MQGSFMYSLSYVTCKYKMEYWDKWPKKSATDLMKKAILGQLLQVWQN